MSRDAFAGRDDDPVDIGGEPEDLLKVLLGDEATPGADDVVEPVMDE